MPVVRNCLEDVELEVEKDENEKKKEKDENVFHPIQSSSY